jgi:putative SOS response-associated peptidase YedK
MCGRYASARKRAELLAEFRVERDRVPESLEPDYNVAPTRQVYAVLSRGSGGSAERPGTQDGKAQRSGAAAPDARAEPAAAAQDVARELRAVRWGLVPSWAKDISISSRLINARAETVDVKPSFRRAFVRRRCLLPADGYYEWIPVSEGGRKRKQPYYIHPADGGVLAFAGLYELWRDKAYPDDHPSAWLWSAVIITTRAEDEVGHIHDRMPMVIDRDLWTEWLDPQNTSKADLLGLLAPAASNGLETYPVSMAVNSVRNNGPQLIEREPSTAAAGGLQ